MLSPLNAAQLSGLTQDLDADAKPFRVLSQGKAVNFVTGHSYGGNIINHPVYWNRPQAFVDAVLEGLRANNPDESFRITRH